MSGGGSSHSKLDENPASSHGKRKRPKVDKSLNNLETMCLDDWKLNMGVSLADRLETIASENNLTILQVKRLLKDVLTNPTVINAFKQYMSGQLTLLEPETGATSPSTRRHAQLIGFDLSSFGPRSNIMSILSRRSITRSLAKKLKAEFSQSSATLPQGNDSQDKILSVDVSKQKPSTLLEMHFSDGDDDAESDKTNFTELIENNRTEDVGTSVETVIVQQRDEDYKPTVDDIIVMQRDLYYDLDDTEAKSISSSALEEDEGGEVTTAVANICTAEPFDIPHRDYYLRSRKSDDASMQDCLSGLTPNILNMLDEADGNMDAEMDALRFANAISAQNNVENDPEDQIYTSFLKSLFDSSPQEKSALSPRDEPTLCDPVLHLNVSKPASEATNPFLNRDCSGVNDYKTGVEECDDPDFDVMAELESICYDDLFDELRSDRAVRISKMEAKKLRRDVVDLLNDDIFGTDFSGFTKAPSPTKSFASTKTLGVTSVEFSPHPPLPPPPFEYYTNKRFQRQLSMHVQLLCSTLACCIHRTDLEKSVCNVVREAFTDFRNSFRAAKRNPYTYVTGLADLNVLFSSASTFMAEFAGLTVLPIPPPVPSASASNPPLLPLPFNLLDFVVRSPIWAYPQFLPRGLASRPHILSKRLFTKDEDNLIVLGLANLIEFAPHRFNLFVDGLNRRNRPAVDDSTVAAAKRAMVFDFITKTLIPTKTSLQLHNRKLYMEKMIQRDWLNVRRNAKSSLYLLILDLISGEFEGVHAQRDLLRACVTSFARRSRAASGSSNGVLYLGSVFSRPSCWSLLPPEYARCCRTLQAQLEAGTRGAPQPSIDSLLPVFTEGTPQNVDFFLSALLTWWPSNNAREMEKREEEIEEVNIFSAPLPPIGISPANMVILLPTLVQSVVPAHPPPCPMRLPTTTGELPILTSLQPQETPLSSEKCHPIRKTQSPPDNLPLAPPRKKSRPYQKQNTQSEPSPAGSNRTHSPSPFLPQVSKIIHSFHVVLDRVLRVHPPPSRPRSSTASLTARFLRRCRRGTPAWLTTVATAGKEADESDVRRARCLLDRCRLHLGRQVHSELVRALTEHQPFIPLDRILHLLSPSRPLWEEFVTLCLTPGQARSLRIYPIYAHLQRVREIHSLLHASLPRAKRLWSRLKKLADARETEELRVHVMEGLPCLSNSPRCNSSRRRPRKRRKKGSRNDNEDDEEAAGEKQKSPRDVYKLVWSLLEAGLKDRYALNAQTAISLDPFQKPYSNFPQTFEVIETLARKPSTSLGHAPSLQQVSMPPAPLPRLVDLFASRFNQMVDDAFVKSLQWEVSTELSSSAPATTKSKLANRCPCHCHDKKKWGTTLPQTPAQSLPSGLATSVVGKPTAKADSLGLRHCIKCSLRVLSGAAFETHASLQVHQGVVYVDECNFHLTHVQIIWPEGFTPSPESPTACVYAPSDPSNTFLLPATTTPLSTQQVLQALGTYHSSKSNFSENAVLVPDLARRQVSVDFGQLILPASRKSTDLPPVDSNSLSPLTDESVKKLGSGTCSSPVYPPSIFQLPPVEVDDEACFNTEAFPQRTEDNQIPVATASSPCEEAVKSSAWSMSEDRRLLEYFRDVGRCSRRLFRKLAAQWPERSMEEMITRFKYLILVAYGEDCKVDVDSSDGESGDSGDDGDRGGIGSCESSCESIGTPIESDHDVEEDEESLD